jgi:acetylornithine/N-succinyldiaminopimelate aminotransferase
MTDDFTSLTSAELYQRYLLTNYAPPPIFLKRGLGDFVEDENGRRYLDFSSGIAVNTLGHAHPHWVASVQSQAAELVHCSNLYGHRGQGLLAARVSESIGPGRTFFCNSGAEANEALIKLSRLYGRSVAGEEGKVFEVIVSHNAFHGRTFGGMSATPQEKIQKGFAPLVPGFKVARLNDIESFRAEITEKTAAIFIETVQGEGGVFPAEVEFLQALRTLCDEHKILLLIDEVQCGMGRSGWMWAFQRSGILPDAVGMAKGIGGGFPLGAIWIHEKFASLFQPGSHGTTYGGSPLGVAAAHAVWDVIESEDLLERVQELGDALGSGLNDLVRDFPEILQEVRGLGFMLGLVFKEDALPWVARLRGAGLLVVAAGNRAVRYLPALTVEPENIKAALSITRRVLAESQDQARL